MVTLTKKERETVLTIFKDYTTFYNANSIGKVLDISHVGAQKILKRLLQENVVTSKAVGRSIIYKLNFDNNYVCHLVSFLLADEANRYKRWKEEFGEIFKKDRIVMLFGSSVRDYHHANDIDIMIVIKKEEASEVNKALKKKEEILPKRLNSIKLTRGDLLKNLKNRDRVIINIVRNAIILYGQNEYVEIMKDVSGF